MHSTWTGTPTTRQYNISWHEQEDKTHKNHWHVNSRKHILDTNKRTRKHYKTRTTSQHMHSMWTATPTTRQFNISWQEQEDKTQNNHVYNACWPKNLARWFLEAHVLLLCFHDVLINMTHIFDNKSWFLCKHVSPWIRNTCFLRVLMLSLKTHDTTYVIAHDYHVDMCHGFHPFTQTHQNQVAYFLDQHMIFVRSRILPVSCAVIRFICCHN